MCLDSLSWSFPGLWDGVQVTHDRGESPGKDHAGTGAPAPSQFENWPQGPWSSDRPQNSSPSRERSSSERANPWLPVQGSAVEGMAVSRAPQLTGAAPGFCSSQDLVFQAPLLRKLGRAHSRATPRTGNISLMLICLSSKEARDCLSVPGSGTTRCPLSQVRVQPGPRPTEAMG